MYIATLGCGSPVPVYEAVWTCDECSALVKGGDMPEHKRWHDRLMEIIYVDTWGDR